MSIRSWVKRSVHTIRENARIRSEQKALVAVEYALTLNGASTIEIIAELGGISLERAEKALAKLVFTGVAAKTVRGALNLESIGVVHYCLVDSTISREKYL